MRLRRLLGIRQKFTVNGVKYRERTTEPLRRAIAKARSTGEGGKLYDVIFPGGASMRIVATPRRTFADISGDSILDPFRAIQAHLRPGMRLVALQSGTGAVGEWAAGIVGPAGAVVALDRDEQSILYATSRYRIPNVSYECGWIDSLEGETDGAFDAAIAVDAIAEEDDPLKTVRELWRITGETGVLILSAPGEPPLRAVNDIQVFSPERLAGLLQEALSSSPPPEQVSIFERGGRTFGLARRSGES